MMPDSIGQSRYRSDVASRRKQPTIDDMVSDLVATLAEPGAHLDRVVVALQLSDAADRYARAEVLAARELDGATWADVGAALGVSRQTAHERFRSGPAGLHSRRFRRDAAG